MVTLKIGGAYAGEDAIIIHDDLELVNIPGESELCRMTQNMIMIR